MNFKYLKTLLLFSIFIGDGINILAQNITNAATNGAAIVPSSQKLNFCPSYDGINCLNSTITKFNTSLNSSNVTYCQTSNNLTCALSNGNQCNLSNGYLCATSDQINLINVTTCATLNNQNCISDKGSFCNSTNPLLCKINKTQNSCPTQDGLNCYNFLPGWYITNDFLTVISYQNISNASYCYSYDGQSCYQDYLSQCNSQTGYNCSTSDQINPALASYCISDDNVTCKIDDGTFCNFTGSNLWCNILNTTNNCPTQDGLNCYNSFFGLYMTYDGANVSPIDQSLNGSYCQSNDGLTCNINNGPDCDLETGYLCATSDQINLIDVYECYTLDQVSCLQDDGTICNFTGSEAWCNLNYTSEQLCATQDGLSCYNFAPGWYMTLDFISVTSDQNISSGSYCYSNDGNTCYSDYLSQCNAENGYNCSTSDQINPALVTYCISDDNFTCKIDDGTFCNFTGSDLWCNIFNETNNCPTLDGQNCYNAFFGLYMTYDGVNVSPIDTSLQGSYCESNDGTTCNINNGPDCDLETGYLCATSDQINLIDVYECYTLDQVSCLQDDGTICNFTGSEAWCNLNYTSEQLCATQDGLSCYNFAPGWYITYDGYNASAIDQNQNGSYCYSQDGLNCYQDYGIGCDEQTGQLCSKDSTGALFLGQYCISMDDLTCYQDQGSLCNFTGQEVWCNIANDTQSCFTQDQATCYFPSTDFIDTGDNTTQSSSSPFAIQFRVSLRDYFFYAISGQEKDASKIGVCDVGCDQWSDKCCANVVYQSGDQIAYDNLCINRWVVQFNFAFQLNGANFTMKCADSINDALRSFAFIQSMLAFTTIISAFIF